MPESAPSHFNAEATRRLAAAVRRALFQREGLLGRFRTGILWNLVATFFGQGSTFLVNILVANQLGERLFGRYALVLTTVQAGALFAGLAMGATATRYIAEHRAREPDRAGRVAAFTLSVAAVTSLLAGLALLAFAEPLATRFLDEPALEPMLRVAGGVLAFATMNATLLGALAGLEAYRNLGRAMLAAGIVYIVAGAGGAHVAGLDGAVFGLLIAGGVQFVLLALALRGALASQNIRPRFRGMFRERGIVGRYALPGAIGGMTGMPALWLAQAFLARQDGGFTALGLFTAALNLTTIVLLLPTVANTVGTSIINHMLGDGRRAGYRRVFWANFWLTVALVGIGALVIAAAGPLLLRLFGPAFTAAWPVLLILLASALADAVTLALYQVVQSRERMWQGLLLVMLPRDFAIPLLAWLLVPGLGAVGLACAYLAGKTLAALIIIAIVKAVGLDLGDDSGTGADIASHRAQPAHA